MASLRLWRCGLLIAGMASLCAAADPLYHEAYRPQFHFTFQRGFLGDINGPLFYQGEYHLFAQCCPGGPALDYARMHWGHAVSTDLVHWRELPLALAPDEKDGVPGSGTAVVDWTNTAGLQTGSEPPIVLFYTGARYLRDPSQDGVICLAYSNDRGRTWTKYEQNPVVEAITHYNRDPKVFWHAPTKRWIMVITLSCADDWLRGKDGDYRFAFFSSPDLKQWQETSRFDMPRGLDCPDMFELPVDGDPNNTRWVFWAGDGTHAIGSFDGTRFDSADGVHLPLLTWQENGSNGYAAQTFSEISPADGRTIQIAWLRHGSYPNMPFNQQASFPCELSLRTTAEGICLYRQPVRELEKLHRRTHRWSNRPLPLGETPMPEATGELYDVRAEIDVGDAEEVGFVLCGHPVTYHVRNKTLGGPSKPVAMDAPGGRITLQVLVDWTTVEVFGNGGRVAISCGVSPKPSEAGIRLFARGGAAKIVSLTVHELRSIWGDVEEQVKP